jgi:hypothetical protein
VFNTLVTSPGRLVEPASPKKAVSPVAGPLALLQLEPVAQLFPAGPFQVTVAADAIDASVNPIPAAAVAIRKLAAQRRPVVRTEFFGMA